MATHDKPESFFKDPLAVFDKADLLTNKTAVHAPLLKDSPYRPFPFKVSPASASNIKKQHMEKIAVNIENFFNELCTPEEREMLVATAFRNGRHARTSKHYIGCAIDFSLRGGAEVIFKKAISPKGIELMKKHNVRIFGPNHGSAPHLHIEVNTADNVQFVNYTSFETGWGPNGANVTYSLNDADIRKSGGYWPGVNEVGGQFELAASPRNSNKNDGGTEYYDSSGSYTNYAANSYFRNTDLKGYNKDLSDREELISFLRVNKEDIPDTPPPTMVQIKESTIEKDLITVHKID